jgi:hypothetical protein
MYNFFVVLHIISAGVIIGLITTSILGHSMRKKLKGTMAELGAIRGAAIMAPVMANIGSIGLLLTGIVATIMQYQSSFFDFAKVPWLAMMQTDYVVILVISLIVMMPRGKKILAKVNAEITGLNAKNGASQELLALVNKQYAMTLVIAVLVFIAIYLGESKSMMWVTGQ